MKRLLVIACALVASPAWAQQIEVAPLTIAGYTSSASIQQKTAGVNDLKIDSGFTWGAEGGYVFPSGAGVEVWWRRQSTGMSIASGGSSVTLFYMKTSDLDANVVYAF